MSLFQIFAKEFAAAFTKENPRKVWSLKDDAPEWMRDAIREAHFDGRLPDDWIYEHAQLIVAELVDLDDAEDADEHLHSTCDSLVDIYTHDLTAWLASRLANVTVCNEARDEGLLDQALASQDCKASVGVENWIAVGQYVALTYVYGALVSAIKAHAEACEPEYYAAHDCDVCDPIEHCSHGEE